MVKKLPEDMDLNELKVLYYDTAKNFELINNNMKVISDLIEKRENAEKQ